MKRHLPNSLIAFSSLAAVLACNMLQPGQLVTQQPAATPTARAFEMPRGRLLVGSGIDDSLQWHIVNLPDQTIEAYPALGSDASHVSISPDFAHFTFQRVAGTDSPTATLYVMDINTGVPTKVASASDKTVSWGNLNWSLDGEWMSYLGYSGYDLRPFAYNLPSGNLKKLEGEIDSSAFGHALSPNGDRLVYVCGYCTESGLYIIDTQGTNPRFLLNGLYSFIVWHPDGTRLYLAEQGGSGMVHHVFSYDLATGAKTEVPDADYLFYPLTLSPNGKLLAFVSSKRGLSFINTDDDSILPISFSISLGGYWSQDSRYICNYSDRGRYVYVLDVQTGERGQIDLGAPDSEVYGWLP